MGITTHIPFLLACLVQIIYCQDKLQHAHVDEQTISILENFQNKLNYSRQVDKVQAETLLGGSINQMVGQMFLNGLVNKWNTSFQNLNISPKCKEDFDKTFAALLKGENWALRMGDAGAKIGSGILDGNVYWLGSYDECLLTTPLNSKNQTVKLFKTQYVLSTIPMTVSPIGFQLGSCVPNSCSASDVSGIVMEVLTLMKMPPTNVSSSIKPESFPIDGPAIAMICVLTVLVVILVIATGYDLIIFQPMLEREEEEKKASASISVPDMRTQAEVHTNTNMLADEYTPLLPVTTRGGASGNSADIHFLAKALVKISIFSNGKKLMHTGKANGSVLGSIHGIRLISMSWVILGHTFFFGLANTQNITIYTRMIKMVSFQAIINATVSVDTFFLLSGVLVSYLLMREMSELGGPKKINWVLFYVHRIWRLTPSYMLVLGCYTALYRYFGNGPMWPGDVPEVHCKDNWWTNLLYINNIYKSQNGCMMWTWYLANDFQFYVISPLILIPLYLHFGAGLAVTLLLMLTSFICTGVISAENEYPPSTVTLATDPSKILGAFKNMYMVPWTRIGPYLVGILVGYALYKTDRKVTLKWYTVTIGWLLAAACNLTILYGMYNVSNGAPISNNVTAFYNAVHRTAWSCGVGWVIFACVTGYGGPVNKILAWPTLFPFSRLTYMAYLIHPIIMEWFYQSARKPFYMDFNILVYLFFAHFVATYGVAIVVSLAFEAPWIGLEKMIFKRGQ